MSTMIHENKNYVLVETRENNGEIITEKSNDGKKLYITGIFTQSEVVNGNRRIYPRSIMEKAVSEYEDKFIKRKQSIGELNHPKDRLESDPSRACLLVEELWWDGNNVMGRAIIPDTSMGREVKGLMEAGWVPGVSSRASGSLKRTKNNILEVQDDLKFHAIIDVVHNPSAPDAYVSGIYENTETGLCIVSEDAELDSTKYNYIDNSNLMRFVNRIISESFKF